MNQENYLLVQQGFRILLTSMSGYIGQEFSKVYKDRWWNEVLYTLSDQYDLPSSGEYGELVDSLDIANCIRLIDRKWNDLFRDVLSKNCRTWAKELMGIRNIVSHIGQQDIDQPTAERALDTMSLLCKEIDSEGERELREIYKIVRARAVDMGGITLSQAMDSVGVKQPGLDANRGAIGDGSLFSLIGTDIVQKTNLTRKVTFEGKTETYPVYKVRLDALYYNDQNDRIATWITKYESENGTDSLAGMNVDIYNRIIEDFINESNPEAIIKTQKNISLVGQREPGVVLPDGRIVDGNRRFTCLRRIQRDSNEAVYFETVIMNADIKEDKKQIKLLELSIQHGEEKKVDYDLIDYAIGTYRDVVLTKLLSVEEYANSTCESIADVKKRIEVASVICEFLDYIKLPEKYHVAREYQVYSLFQEMMTPLRQLNDDEKIQLKTIAFNNAMMKAMPDQRKFIRDIKGLVKNNTYQFYFEEQVKIGQTLKEKYDACEIHGKTDIDEFAFQNMKITESLQMSMEKALQRSRATQLKSKPSENVSKSISLMLDVDSRLFDKLNPEEKNELRVELDELEEIVMNFKKLL